MRRGKRVLVVIGLLGLLAPASQAADTAEAVEAQAVARRSGTVTFRPADNEASLPPQFQLPEHTFPFDAKPLPTTSRAFRICELTFPSPVVTPHANNNTVHCEYFCPVTPGKHPGVIVLHILGGDFDLARLFCRSLAQHGTAALFVKMPYYGPRRQPGVSARMVSYDPEEIVRGMTQAIQDIRWATAWLASQDEIDSTQLGIMGISLGGITSALAATAEPRLQKICLLLAGGDIGQVAFNSRELAPLRKRWTDAGGTQESLQQLLSKVDPVTYGKNVVGRKILMLNARNDEVIPRACTESLWRAFGEPEIIWWDAGHFSAARYIFEGLAKTTRFFCEPK